jgi:hypothetical protein
MVEMKLEDLERYLNDTVGPGVELTGAGEIGKLEEQGMKDFGYGKPLLISYKKDGREEQAVISMMRGDEYGHQFWWDRARILMYQYELGGKMEKHCRPLALGYLDEGGRMVPVKDVREFFIINEKIEGRDYFLDLERIRKGDFRDEDLELAKEFARWLARLHSRKNDAPDLYQRRVRQTIGDDECIWGILDGYPHPYEHFPPERCIAMEKTLIDWRWKLKGYPHRLAAVHGDFHPWNVLVLEDGDFRVLDRSRGEWGEPGDDVSTMSLNFMLFGLYEKPELSGHFEKMYRGFWDEYMSLTNDTEMLEVVAPFYVFRTLVIASPAWYPNHPLEVRKGLLGFMENVLADERFDYENINAYLKG